MSATHTPGPWRANECNVMDRRGVIIAIARSDGDMLPVAVNARLMAAAPDLLEALTRLLNVPEKLTETEHFDYMANAERIARNVLAKAEGRQA